MDSQKTPSRPSSPGWTTVARRKTMQNSAAAMPSQDDSFDAFPSAAQNNDSPSDVSITHPSANSSKKTRPEHTSGHGKGRSLPWPLRCAIDFKRRNLDSMWHKKVALVNRRGSDKVLDAETAAKKLVPGAIINVAHHSEFSNLHNVDTIPWDDPYKTATAFGVVYSKYRKFVVIFVHRTHLTCLPVYTHNGRGMDGRVQDEQIAIRDSHSDTTAPQKPGPVHKCLVAEMATVNYCENNKASSYMPRIDANACVQLTKFATIWKDSPLTYEGRLIASDTQRLKGIVLSLLK